ncbi:hypothetical protein HI914_02175 [Erysiphe necator]|nr:hypothetical protein HI914_02175 [Erysiphe necator]
MLAFGKEFPCDTTTSSHMTENPRNFKNFFHSSRAMRISIKKFHYLQIGEPIMVQLCSLSFMRSVYAMNSKSQIRDNGNWLLNNYVIKNDCIKTNSQKPN